MQSGQFQHEKGLSALYQGAEGTSVPHQWAVENSPKTKGEKHYDRLIGSTTYLGTFAASLAGAYFFKHTKMGVKFLDPHIEKLTQRWAAKGFKDPKGSADTAVTIGALMAGGTVPAIPFKMLEDTRIDRIKSYNEKHGTGIDDPVLRELANERINNIPKQSNASAAFGRLSAMGLTLAFGIFLPTAGKIKAAQVGLAKKLPEYRLSLGKLLFNNYAEKQAIKGAEQFTAAERHKFMGRDLDEYIVVDGTWSAFTAGVLLGASRLGAAIMGDKKQSDAQPALPNDPTPHSRVEQAQAQGHLTAHHAQDHAPSLV